MKLYVCLLVLCAVAVSFAEITDPNLKRLDWLVGSWVGEHQGKVRWPTIPTMTYGEELVVQEAPYARAAGVRMLNYTARSWAHSTKDHLHDEWGYIWVDSNGIGTLMTTGNNGFNKYEEGPVHYGLWTTELKDIGRIDHIRDLPVEMLKRTFRTLGSGYLEQVLEMRTETHPKDYPGEVKNTRTREHARIIYKKLEDESKK